MAESVIDWPIVTIGGNDYALKYSFRASYQASKRGIDLRELRGSAGTFSTTMDFFALLVEPYFDPGKAPSGEDWAGKVEGFEHFKLISKAIDQAIQAGEPKKEKATEETPTP